ncbi:MAG TPA: hypothetical protein VGR73_15930 [Bryobacteraceae bacterium]|nr:hypothetical protein [Bryobacteraceae bacterium]
MRTLRFISIILGFALAAIPASATITYTACDGGCTVNSGGSYAAWQAAPGASGLAFGALTTFVSGGLAGTGIYTDSTTGVIFTNYSSGGSVDNGTHVTNGAFVQGFSSGTGTGIEIDLPANTYAFAMFGSDCSSAACTGILFNGATVGLGTHSSFGTNYALTIPGSGPAQFFGIVSDTPITSLLFATGGGASGFLSINSFEIGEGGTATPEARTALMVGGGLIALYFCRRRRPQAPRQVPSPHSTIAALTPAHR